jgi:branched-chain amino acid transport system ATP-binding protein
VSAHVVELTGVTKRFGGVTAVDDVTLALEPGSITGLIGPNGAGKTTLLNLLTGYLTPTAGSIRVGGQDVTGRRPHVVAAAGVGRTYQNLLLLDQETVRENVAIGRHRATSLRARRSAGPQPDVVGDLLQALGIADVAESPVAALPYGVRRRVEMARALATEPRVLVLDEPTAGMTRDEGDDIGELVQRVRERGTTVLLVEHNVRLVSAVCDEVAVLQWGRLIARTSAELVWQIDEVRTAYLGQPSTTEDASGATSAAASKEADRARR